METFGLPNLKRKNIKRKRKRPTTNVIDITLVLIPEYQENGSMGWKKTLEMAL